VVSDVGDVIVAEYWGVTAEKMRMVLSDERRILCDEGDQRKFDIDVEKAAGRGIARVA
jgi:hypothetical protein